MKLFERCVMFTLVGVLCVSLAGCSLVDGILPNQSGNPSQVTSNPEASEPVEEQGTTEGPLSPPPQISFDLVEPEKGGFGDPGVAQSTGAATGLYTIGDDGYAYALDPTTFEATGEPLDPVTREPIAVDSTPEPSEAVPVETDSIAESEAPTEDVLHTATPVVSTTPTPTVHPDEKLPNMGLFLDED